MKEERISEYNINPPKCLGCDSILPFEFVSGKYCRRYCSQGCANSKSKARKKRRDYILQSIKWNEVQKSYDEGTLKSHIPKKFGFSMDTLNKAEKKGLFIRNDTDLHKKTLSKLHSERMKKLYKDGKHMGWATVNTKSERSYPETFFYKVLIKNGLMSRYNIIEKMQVSKYTLDFVFVEYKLDVEIDGQQHFRTNEAIMKDRERDTYLIDKGWRVYRIAWSEMYKNPEKEINAFLIYIKNISNESSRIYDVLELRNALKIKKYANQQEYYNVIRKKVLEDNKPKITLMLNSNIDFSQFGWVKQASDILKLKHQKVKEWMKKYMPEVYAEKCFKKSCSDINIETEKIKLVKSSNIDFTKKGWGKKLAKLINRKSPYKWFEKYIPELHAIRYTQNSISPSLSLR